MDLIVIMFFIGMIIFLVDLYRIYLDRKEYDKKKNNNYGK